MKKYVFSLCASVLALTLGATPAAFQLIDREAAGIPRARLAFDAATAFPNAPFTAEETARGYRFAAVDMCTNWHKPFAVAGTQAETTLRLIACPGDYTVEGASVFTVKALDEVKIAFSDLKNENGAVITPDNQTVLQIAPYDSVPRWTYAQLLMEPDLKNLKANQQVDLLYFVNVPADAAPGIYRGTLCAGDAELAITLRVASFQLPEAGHFGFFMNGKLYDPKENPATRIVQTGFVEKNLKPYFDFYKTRRMNAVSLYDAMPDLHYVDGKVQCAFADYSAIAKAMNASGLDGQMIIDMRDIGYWCNAVSMKLDTLGGKAPAGDIGVYIHQRKILTQPTDRYPEKAKELYAEALHLLLKQARAENWPGVLVFADEELGNQYGFKIANYESYMPVLLKEARDRAIVIDNGIGYGRANATEYAARDNAVYRCYNSWTEEALANAKRDKAVVSAFNYGTSRLCSGFTQVRLGSTGHLQWADLWDSYNYQWQFTRLSEKGIVTSLVVERMHEGIMDYAACKYLEQLAGEAEKAGKTDLAAGARKVLHSVIDDLEILHEAAQIQGRNMSSAELKTRRWHVIEAIEKLRAALGKAAPVMRCNKFQRVLSFNNYKVQVDNETSEKMADNAELTEKFWSRELGPFSYIEEYLNELKAKASNEEDFARLNQPERTIARVASLPEGLAIYTEMGVVQPKAPYLYQRPDDDGDMWLDDCIEVFFRLPNGQAYQFIYNSAGKKVFLNMGRLIPAKDIKSFIRYPLNEEGGTANKLLIPWSYFDLEGQPLPGTVWAFNIGREFPTRVQRNLMLTSWAPVFTNFGEQEKWGTLTFGRSAANPEAIPVTLAVEKNASTIVMNGDEFKFFVITSAPTETLTLEGTLKDESGLTVTLPAAEIPTGDVLVAISTETLHAGIWTLQLRVKGQEIEKKNAIVFTVVGNPWR